MTRTLILTRHAKSSWNNPQLDDFDRPLNGRGRSSATKIGVWLNKNDYTPQEVLVSGARRTVETWGHMAPKMPADITMRSDPALYHAGPETILSTLRAAHEPTVMLICHNPGIAEFASRIVSKASDHIRFDDYPTCATTVIRFGIENWNDAAWGSGDVVDFVIPREIA
jgi:phosphohistidine phosphatase